MGGGGLSVSGVMVYRIMGGADLSVTWVMVNHGWWWVVCLLCYGVSRKVLVCLSLG